MRLWSCARARGASPIRAQPSSSCIDGLVAHSQNAGRPLSFDLRRVNSVCSRRFAAGFYYKTFMWPASFWERLYEPLIRRAAGLGAPAATRSRPLRTANAFCDVLVIGSGLAGLTAALAAARSGARVIVCEEDFVFGGRLLTIGTGSMAHPEPNGSSCHRRRACKSPSLQLMSRHDRVWLFTMATLYGAIERVSDHRPAPAPHQPRQRVWRIMAKRTVVATGAAERPIAVRRQRSSRHYDGGRRPHLREPLRCGGRDGRSWCLPTIMTVGALRVICVRRD